MWGVDVQDNGSWVASDGMTHAEINRVFKKFAANRNLGLVTVNALPFLIDDAISRMLMFSCFARGIVPPERGLAALRDQRHDQLFPIVLGTLDQSDGQARGGVSEVVEI